MVYPQNFEEKIGFDRVRDILSSMCLSSLGKEKVDAMTMSVDAAEINELQTQTREFRRVLAEHDDFPMTYFFDVREAVMRIKPENTHMEEDELFDLMRSLSAIDAIVAAIRKYNSEDETQKFPALMRLTDDIIPFPQIVRRINVILDKAGRIKDGASFTLANIRDELKRTNGKISSTLNTILHRAQVEGLVSKDATPTMRDGRLMLPVSPQAKRKIMGIVHDESATGKTVFIEPAEVVEVNNRIRELESEERREEVRILTEFTKEIRPYIKEIVDSYQILARIDFLQAKAKMADEFNAFEPEVTQEPQMDWVQAEHPLLKRSLTKQGRKIVPLDIVLTRENHIMIISGPNAGGKSICLKTTGLLQYMLQCGLPIPVRENSKTGVFTDIMIDIGDEQSIDNDLSTYSSHLLNMKTMMKQCRDTSLLLIDEFGGGTEPQIGGALAESFLDTFLHKKAWAVITTHYQNLKLFADDNEGIVNAAMLYDRGEMRPLFQLAIGNPGSSFAIEIARNIGLPENVIKEASEKVGQDYIQSDKYLQDIVRDKRYWERKRQNIHQKEKEVEQAIAKYEEQIAKLKAERKEIIETAKDEAARLLKESNARIERTIKEIKEKQARKEATKKARQKLSDFAEKVEQTPVEIKTKTERPRINVAIQPKQEPTPKIASKLEVGAYVKISGQETVGKIESISGKNAICIFGQIRTNVKLAKLEPTEAPKQKAISNLGGAALTPAMRRMREEIDNKRNMFKPELDVRGMRGDEALNTLVHYIDDAMMIGMPTVRILHGKGDGILRHLVRQYLSTVRGIKSYRDENVQFGGTGITVVDI
ncbi:MAG: Smr/MutS family protein [Prevotellaceae bacterium]|nr:Smr/MutS family protein [Prevotellaceae bacterium]